MEAPLVVLRRCAGRGGPTARRAERVPDETFGLAIRTYAESPVTPSATEASDPPRRVGTPVPGYGWIFPAGDGTVNIGVGALSTMKGSGRSST